jgi:hypothetical protein
VLFVRGHWNPYPVATWVAGIRPRPHRLSLAERIPRLYGISTIFNNVKKKDHLPSRSRGFRCLQKSRAIHASNSVMYMDDPAIMMKFVCPGGFHV